METEETIDNVSKEFLPSLRGNVNEVDKGELNTRNTPPSAEADTSPQSREGLYESRKGEITDNNLEDINLYGTEAENNEINNATEVDYINFEDDTLLPFKDVFKDSKISKADFENFKTKIEEKASAKEFSKDMIEIYGEEAPKVLNDYQRLTNNIFTPEEKETLNRLPSIYKTLMVKMGKTLGEKYNKLQADYGILNQETQAIPELNRVNAEERFNKLTEQLLNGRLSAEEYNHIKKERLELAKYL